MVPNAPRGVLGEGRLFGDVLGRGRWLRAPWFLACLAVLVVNDHVLKERFPGWWTGKLSDIGGVAVVGVLLSVALGRRVGLGITAFGFCALKLIPVAGLLASPVLGGGTVRDPSDLLAVAAVVPLWRGMATQRTPKGGDRGAIASPRGRVVASFAASWAGLLIAVVATTATSCSPSPAVTRIVAQDGAFFALVDMGWEGDRWGRSEDGGRSWRRSTPPAGEPPPTTDDPYDDQPLGPSESCVESGCFRVRDQLHVDWRSLDGVWNEEFALTPAQSDDITTGCAGGSRGVLTSVAAYESKGVTSAVASLGAAGSVSRQSDGTWLPGRTLDAAPPRAAPRFATLAAMALLSFGPVLAVVLGFVGRRRWPSWGLGVAVCLAGWLTLIMATGVMSLLAAPSDNPLAIIGPIVVIGGLATTVASVAVARRASNDVRSRGADRASGS